MNKLIWVMLPFSVILLIGNRVENGACIKSFESFAYDGPSARNFDTTLPFPPWQIEATIPPYGREEYHEGELIDSYRSLDVALSRSTNGHQEIWITGQVGRGLEDTAVILIYQPDLQAWEFVSPYIEGTELYVKDLFVDSDRRAWGETQWSIYRDYPEIETIPVLSRFNERTRRFEFAEGVLENSLDEALTYYNYTEIVYAQDIFWIFADDGNIYRYDPLAQTTDKQGDYLSGQVIYTALSPDGSIYFTPYNAFGMNLRLRDNPTKQFLPDTGEVRSVEYPAAVGDWPPYAGLLVDHTGQLWLGAIGYRDLDAEWNLIHPAYLNTYSDHLGQYMWAAPKIMLESSDGRLWYRKYLDSGGLAEGTAWYDPEAGEGCLFTNIATNIVEDSQQQLWLAADGILYRYALNQ